MVVVVDDWILGSLERPTNRPKDSTRRKDDVWRVRDGSRDSGTAKTDTRCGGSTQRATQTDQDTNKYGEGGWDIRAPYLLPLLSMDIDEERFVVLWRCGWLFLLGGF